MLDNLILSRMYNYSKNSPALKTTSSTSKRKMLSFAAGQCSIADGTE